MFGLFEKYDQAAQATILSLKYMHSYRSSSNAVAMKHEFVLDVKPEQDEPFRTTIRQRLPAIIRAPQEGDVVNVKYNAKTKKAKLHLKGDIRYDLNMLVHAQQLDAQKRQEAIRNSPVGTPLPTQSHEAQHAFLQEMMRRKAENKPPML
jgi:hypothetical protein